MSQLHAAAAVHAIVDNPTNNGTRPWRAKPSQRDALGLACDVRLADVDAVHQMILTWPTDRIVDALLTSVAMVDIDRAVSDLLEWDHADNGTCNAGHPWTYESMYRDKYGYRRCRVCARNYRAAKRAEAKAAA